MSTNGPTRLLAPHPAVCWLEGLSLADEDIVGTTAAGLGALTRAGLPVPAGFVVTTETRSPTADPPSHLIRLAYTDLCETVGSPDNTPVVVRASMGTHDHAPMALAGRDWSMVPTTGLPSIVARVSELWRSGDDVRSVLVHAWSRPTTVGVVWSVDPQSDDGDRVLIKAHRVGTDGAHPDPAEPDVYVVSRQCFSVIQVRLARSNAATPIPVLGDAQALALAQLVLTAEHHVGRPLAAGFAIDAYHRIVFIDFRPASTARSSIHPETRRP